MLTTAAPLHVNVAYPEHAPAGLVKKGPRVARQTTTMAPQSQIATAARLAASRNAVPDRRVVQGADANRQLLVGIGT